MSVEATYYTQKRDRTFILSLIFFISVLALSIGLYAGNWHFETENTTLKEKISTSESTIKALKQDKKVQVYDLVQANEATLKKLAGQSQISKFIKQVKYLGSQYDITFKTFSYSNGIIATTGVLSDNTKGLAYIKLAKFVEDYRKKTDAIFDILFINSVVGQDQIEVNLQLKVK